MGIEEAEPDVDESSDSFFGDSFVEPRWEVEAMGSVLCRVLERDWPGSLVEMDWRLITGGVPIRIESIEGMRRKSSRSLSARWRNSLNSARGLKYGQKFGIPLLKFGIFPSKFRISFVKIHNFTH